MPANCSEQVVFPPSVQGPAAGDPRTAASVRSMGDGLNQRMRWCWDKIQLLFGTVAPIGGTPTPITSCNVATGVFSLSAHNLNPSDPVRLFVGASGGSLPTATPAGTIYYVVYIDANTFGLSSTSGGSQLTSLGGGLSGECYVVKIAPDSLANLFFPTVGSVNANTVRGLLPLLGFLAANQTWTGSNLYTGQITRGGVNARYVKRPPVIVPDAAGQTIDTTMGDVFILTAPATATRTLILRQTSAPQPVVGESIYVIQLLGIGTTGVWQIQREGSGSTMASFTATSHCALALEVRDGGSGVPHWCCGPSTANVTMQVDAS
jgi:hypothetical protein